MESDSTLTVYTKTQVALPEYITACSRQFESLYTLKAHLGKKSQTLSDLFNHDALWMRWVTEFPESITNIQTPHFNKLNFWIENFKNSPNSYDPTSKDLGYLIQNCYYSLILTFIYDQENFDKAKEIALQTYKAYKSQQFPTMVKKSIESFMKAAYWDNVDNRISYESLVEALNKLLRAFTSFGINQIFWEEIKNHLKPENQDFFEDQLLRILNYIYRDITGFRRFINRNYLYQQIDNSLDKNLAFYKKLKDLQGDKRANYSITITKTPDASSAFKDRVFKVSSFGIEDSPRYVADHLITFGRESSEEFTNDITLPGMNDYDSIFGVIFINRLGLNLIDVSQESAILVKIPPNDEIELIDNTVIRFGENHEVVVNIIQGADIGEFGKVIKFSRFGKCETTRTIWNIELNQYSRLSIGKWGCDLNLEYDDVAEKHAEIYFNRDKKNFMLKDHENVHGTFYRLKKNMEIQSHGFSEFVTLQHNQTFYIFDFCFFVKNENLK